MKTYALSNDQFVPHVHRFSLSDGSSRSKALFGSFIYFYFAAHNNQPMCSRHAAPAEASSDQNSSDENDFLLVDCGVKAETAIVLRK